MKIRKFLAQSSVFAIYQANLLILEPLQARFAKENLHLLQGLIISALFFEDRETRPSELAKVFHVSQSNLSHALRSLERKGFVKRSTRPEDARGYWFVLSAAGRKKALMLVKAFDDIEDQIEKQAGAKNTKELIASIGTLRSSSFLFTSS